MPGTGEPEKRVAIYGGSFNPPHVCHQLVVLYALETRPLDEVWLVPCFRHAFDKALAPFDLRMDWCRRLIEPFQSRCRVLEIEKEMGETSRTLHTLEALEKRYPACSFSLILGSDIHSETADWYRFDDIERRYPILWVERENHRFSDDSHPALPDVSSSMIRRKLSSGIPVEPFVPARVLKAIEASGWRWNP